MMHGQSIFRKKVIHVVKVNSKKGAGIKSIQGVIQEACKEKIERDQKARNLKPSGPCDGGGHPECRKVYIYQCTGRKSLCKDRQ